MNPQAANPWIRRLRASMPRAHALPVMLMVTMCFIAAAGGARATALRDPTRPPQPAVRLRAAAAPSMPVVSAILSRLDGEGSPASRRALVDGRWHRAGDSVGGGRILAIDAGAVRWERAGRTHELRLTAPENPIKKPAVAPTQSKGAS
ncbi:MAG: hypothetical protein U1F35_05965 [Steroidobacteraceae bacterium]